MNSFHRFLFEILPLAKNPTSKVTEKDVKDLFKWAKSIEKAITEENNSKWEILKEQILSTISEKRPTLILDGWYELQPRQLALKAVLDNPSLSRKLVDVAVKEYEENRLPDADARIAAAQRAELRSAIVEAGRLDPELRAIVKSVVEKR